MFFRLIPLLGIAILAGCGPSSKVSYTTGRVTYKGKNVPFCRVIFHSPRGEKIPADCGAEGRYSTTIPPGEYKVSIEPPSMGVVSLPKGKPRPVRPYSERYTIRTTPA